VTYSGGFIGTEVRWLCAVLGVLTSMRRRAASLTAQKSTLYILGHYFTIAFWLMLSTPHSDRYSYNPAGGISQSVDEQADRYGYRHTREYLENEDGLIYRNTFFHGSQTSLHYFGPCRYK
jgi:hypothetical protein